MDEMLARLNRIYPNSGYVLIKPYNPETWVDRAYDSSFDDKAAQNRWKTNPLSYDEAQIEVSKGNRIGWIVPKNHVVVDIDNASDVRDQERIERILEKFEVKYSYNYTSKGIHILFKDPSGLIKSDSRTKCGLNIAIDTRANGTGYIVLPCNDPHRTWGEWSDFVEDIPYFLKPLMKDTTPSFIGLNDGDGRNNALFKWRTRLEQSHKLSDEEVEKCIRIINENLFDTPMPNNELFKTVLREKAKDDRPSKLEKENPYNSIAEDIISKYDIISYYDNLYKFNGVYYEPIEDMEIERIIHFDVSKNVNKSGRKEILDFIRVKTQISKEDFDKCWYKIACKNGIINLITGELETPTKADYNTICITCDYNPDPVYSARIDEFMKSLCGGDVIKMQFLYQIVGYCLLKKNMFAKFFIFQGEGGTGKSTFTNLIQKLVGGKNVSRIALEHFDNDYYLATMVSKLVNIDDDVVDGKTLEYTGRFKSVIAGEEISVRQIFQAVMKFTSYATCMFSCNRLPYIKDNTSGLFRRMILIELNNKVKNPDILFMQKLTDADMEYFLFKAVQGIKQALEEGKFKISESEEQLLQKFRRRQNPINQWLYENDIRLEDLVDKPCMPLYMQYVEWCNLNGYTKTITALNFKESICTLYDVEIDKKSIDNKLAQVFTKRGAYDSNYKPF